MSQLKTVDYIIVGLGLAGGSLAMQLIRRNKSVIVFDQPLENRSTSVAAGLINPITGKMLAKTHMADMLFPYFLSFYADAEKLLGKKIFFPMPLYRPFGSVEEQNEWMGRSTHGSMKNYIEQIFLNSTFGKDVHDPVGGVLLRQSGYVDTPTFIQGIRTRLIDSEAYRSERFEEEKIQEVGDYVQYDGWMARKIIYCGGVADLSSRYFSALPIKPLKGETLQVKMEKVERIYNRGVYVVPAPGAGLYNVGATYDFDLTPANTENGRLELETKLAELVRLPYEIVSQNWGIRPTTPDRRPILGPHPRHRNLVIFNGLGTKGASLAPYFSGQLADWLGGESEIIPEVNIGRFKSLYSKFD